MARIRRADGSYYWTDPDEARRDCEAWGHALASDPPPVYPELVTDAPPEDDVPDDYKVASSFRAHGYGLPPPPRGHRDVVVVRAAWASSAGALPLLIETLGLPPIRVEVRYSLKAQIEAMLRDERAGHLGPVMRDLLTDYITGRE